MRNKAVHIALGVRGDGAKEIVGTCLERQRGRLGMAAGQLTS